ncbi:flagellar hook protein FlgE [Bacillus mesophilus]|uniref:Flagellar hook protein FlgE n=1 Tax=Bacillus mesophilus TaxID=1808955 RepID=A0A6M0Q3A6_9BACI|nr:flagellar basal body rod protein FlgG [Bacillus mesophilus]MBM7659357.1 flagellar hook protein FlgE [Bacillus mesophilus]NEY70229.1 flagellar basal body rod protein FlgG [Bacillus mesophilus]
MLRSMYSGISGMKNFQTKLDVIGNNIANVNTYGYKKGRVMFKDLVSQQIAGASASTDTRGGVNPKQVGLGSQLASIDSVHTQGSLQTTGRSLDLALSGDGFFMLGTLTENFDAIKLNNNQFAGNYTASADVSYTRAGNFYMDKEGYVVNGDGLFVLGQATHDDGAGNITNAPGLIKIPTDAKSFSIGTDGTVNYVDNLGNLQVAGQLEVAKFANSGGLEKVGGNLFKDTANSGLPVFSVPGEAGSGTIVAGTLEMSNVDLSEEFTEMITTQRGFQANTRIITTSDEILQELVNLKR